MADDEQLEQLRSVLAHAYEKRQSLAVRMIQALMAQMSAHTRKRPIIESLHIEKNEESKDVA
jgi:hypothetical protein